MQNSNLSAAKHVVIIAGEESGDKHASQVAQTLLQKYPNLKLTGIGGMHMQKAGVELISDLARFGVTGSSEVIRHFNTIRKAFAAIKQHLSTSKPDLLVLVDYPGFNLRLAKYAKRVLGLKIIYYISPQIWAWKASRIHLIKECVDKMAVILPFEKKIYEQANVPVAFVGHPLVDKVVLCNNIDDARKTLDLPLDKRIIALLPGSRTNEIKYHMPVLVESAKRLCAKHQDIHFIIPVAQSLDIANIDAYLVDQGIPYTLHKGESNRIVALSDCAVVASGTASLECALLEKPMCIIYKASMLSFVLAFIFIKVRYLGLCNLLQNEMIAPELLQYDCNPQELTHTIESLLYNQATSQRMISRLRRLKQSLSAQNADCTISALIENEIYS